MCPDIFGVAEYLQASGIGLDLVDCAVELRGLAVGGENICPKEVADSSLEIR